MSVEITLVICGLGLILIYGRILQFQSICCTQWFVVLATASFNLLSCLWLLIIQPSVSTQIKTRYDFVKWYKKRTEFLTITHVTLSFVLVIVVLSSQLQPFLWNNIFFRNLSKTLYVHVFHLPHVSPKVCWTKGTIFESHFYVIFSILIPPCIVTCYYLVQ
jgi:hypothetical protein